jgi:hypothetical protein
MKKINFQRAFISMVIYPFITEGGLCSTNERDELPGLLRPSTIRYTDHGTIITPISESPVVRTYTYNTGSHTETVTDHQDGKFMVPSGTNIGRDSAIGKLSLGDIGTGKGYPLTEVKKDS